MIKECIEKLDNSDKNWKNFMMSLTRGRKPLMILTASEKKVLYNIIKDYEMQTKLSTKEDEYPNNFRDDKFGNTITVP